MASHEGVGALLTWARVSAQISDELVDLISPYPVERLGFEEGRELQRRILQAYGSAQASGHLLHERFESPDAFNKALGLFLQEMAPATRVTLLLQDAEAKGVYSTTVEAISRKALDLLRFDGDSILLTVKDIARGLVLDREVTDANDEVLELELWGRIAS